MKNQKGVSMFEVVIAIIILLFIAFFAVYNARNVLPQAKATEVYSEMKSVEAAIEFIKSQMIMRDDFVLESGKHYDATGESDNTYIIYGILNDENDGTAAKNLGLSDLKRDYEYTVYYNSDGEVDRIDFKLHGKADIQGTEVETIEDVSSLINRGVK